MKNLKIVPISRGLRADLMRWISWVECGAPEGNPFSRRRGLCNNLSDHFDELSQVFLDQGLNVSLPFGYDAYFSRISQNNQHQYVNRLWWVRFMIANCPVKEEGNAS